MSSKAFNDEFSDYDGLTGLYVATGRQMLPLNTPEALSTLGQSAMLLSLGASERADEYERLLSQAAQAA
jgi:hypothetical protein